MWDWTPLRDWLSSYITPYWTFPLLTVVQALMVMICIILTMAVYTLAERKVISAAEFDATQSKYSQKKAAVDNMQSVIDKKKIRAPFDGTAGIRVVNPGQMVKVGDALVSLQALGQVFVDFALPQQQLADVKTGLAVKVTTDAVPNREFEGW